MYQPMYSYTKKWAISFLNHENHFKTLLDSCGLEGILKSIHAICE